MTKAEQASIDNGGMTPIEYTTDEIYIATLIKEKDQLKAKVEALAHALRQIAQYNMGHDDWKTAYKLRRDLANQTLDRFGLPLALQSREYLSPANKPLTPA